MTGPKVSEPRTEAGRALVESWLGQDDFEWVTTEQVLAIEAQARADALREAAERVRYSEPLGRGPEHDRWEYTEECIRAILSETDR